MANPEEGYINYFEILGVDRNARRGEVRKAYLHRMKALIAEIARMEITEERRNTYLLEIAKLNAAYFVLRDAEQKEHYAEEREALIRLEREWCQAVAENRKDADTLRRDFNRRIRDFLSRYIEETMLAAGRDRECVEASNWDEAHERHAFRILRHYRQILYQKILERLPYVDTTPPEIDWQERAATVTSLLSDAMKRLPEKSEC